MEPRYTIISDWPFQWHLFDNSSHSVVRKASGSALLFEGPDDAQHCADFMNRTV